MLLQVKTGQVELVQTLQSDPVAWSFDVARGRFYWADGRGRIYRSDGQHSATLHTGEFRRPRFKRLDLFGASCSRDGQENLGSVASPTIG